MKQQLQTAIFGSGCFWCSEAVFIALKGVVSTIPGYAGGNIEYPTYEQVCQGNTGHAEVTKIEFDPSIISYRTSLEVFFSTHDPTTLNRQGNELGEQYRSVIFYTSDEQRQEAKNIIKEFTAEGIFLNKIVTTVEPLDTFYKAEDYHKDYYANNPNAGYCVAVINPKLKKFKEKYARLLKA